ncbi:hypothetical protein PsYK624_123430 [Phanerochaete sordida]|uniref:Uncharacterized protein n=1 Tax=Phanerochaete sordida TaxID=48140 RepID=A0A9P3GME5_9APHY|nr:hypothetical protein PsYK624_123430 [Phanerochaete sordida]
MKAARDQILQHLRTLTRSSHGVGWDLWPASVPRRALNDDGAANEEALPAIDTMYATWLQPLPGQCLHDGGKRQGAYTTLQTSHVPPGRDGRKTRQHMQLCARR